MFVVATGGLRKRCRAVMGTNVQALNMQALNIQVFSIQVLEGRV
jgi:hypothetical protein